MSPAAFLQPLLYAEGPTDYHLLGPLLRRLVEAVCLEAARSVVDVVDVQGVDAPGRFQKDDRSTRILEAARGYWGGATVLFIHADGAGDPEGKRAEQVTPAMDRIAAELRGGACVPVMPVRELEAWTLADGDALRIAFGTTAGDDALGIAKRPRDVEKILDPKRQLRAALEAAGGPSRRRRRAEDFYGRIGERIELDKLRQVPAFAAVEAELRAALRRLGILRHDA